MSSDRVIALILAIVGGVLMVLGILSVLLAKDLAEGVFEAVNCFAFAGLPAAWKFMGESLFKVDAGVFRSKTVEDFGIRLITKFACCIVCGMVFGAVFAPIYFVKNLRKALGKES